MSPAEAPVMLITGGTGSIGSEITRQALAAGYRLVVQGSSEASVKALLASLDSDAEARLATIVTDIRQPTAVENLVNEAAKVFGRIDAVVDCLVTGPQGILGSFTETDPAAYAELAELSLVYIQRLAHASLPHLRKSQGSLVTFVSDAGIFAAPRQTLIGAARAGTIGFVRNLAVEEAREGVRVNCISPSFVDNTRAAEQMAAISQERLDKARSRAGLGLPSPADIAPLAVFLCGEGARYITGQVISVNGGLNA